LRGPTSKGGRGREGFRRGEGIGRGGEGREGKGGKGKEREGLPGFCNPL